ncbi:glutamine--fructose-6-phosphate transaminase (isomerizing) [bacterium]|nr:glutamine--fructose-6-phosphate transaminase (isomerizing) [bacterium]
MCSVVGYVGTGKSRDAVVEGLQRLEYRGYDSAGFACLDSHGKNILAAKAQGALSNLIDEFKKTPIDGSLGIGHTRWATHGAASVENAHPHFDCKKRISVVHNGIIENFLSLKQELKNHNHIFSSDTDTEVIAHLFEHYLDESINAHAAFIKLISRLKGAYAFIALVKEHPDTLFVARNGSPLCIGVGKDEHFIASDVLAFAGKAHQVIFLPDHSYGLVTKDEVHLFDHNGTPLKTVVQPFDLQWHNAGKDGHEHFMLKEIYEQKKAITRTVTWLQSMSTTLWDTIGLSSEFIQELEQIVFLGCGTSWHAGRIAEFFFESVAKVPATSALASEFKFRAFYPNKKSFFMPISQSGETADTLEALRFVKSYGLPTVALTNAPSSSMVREADGFLLTQAGPEIAVASTKAFSTQIAALYWLAHRMAVERKLLSPAAFIEKENNLLTAAYLLEEVIEKYKNDIITFHAARYAKFERFIFLGRHITYSFALEAALKLKEISYVFCQAYPAGELKHGPIALVDEHTPVFIFSHPESNVYVKLLSNAQEVKARKGHLVVFAFEGQDELINLADLAFIIPPVEALLAPLVFTGIMQFFAYQIAKERGCAIDKPRNLAKSVTVE